GMADDAPKSWCRDGPRVATAAGHASEHGRTPTSAESDAPSTNTAADPTAGVATSPAATPSAAARARTPATSDRVEDIRDLPARGGLEHGPAAPLGRHLDQLERAQQQERGREHRQAAGGGLRPGEP